MDAKRAQRAARQMVETDALLGLDAVPVGDAPAPLPVGTSPAPAPPTPAKARAPSPRPAPETAPQPAPQQAAHASAPPSDKVAALAQLEQEITAWLEAEWDRNGWNRVVFGEGDPDAKILFIGEGPGADEDKQGRPFVGRAGQLLDKQIAAMGLAREQVYIANIVKTRPPGNRVPTPDEAALCMPYLVRQIEIIAPQVIVTLGATAAKYLLDDPKIAITRARGQWRPWRGIDVMPTFHPAYLLRQYTPDNRRKVWQDLQKVMERVGLPMPPK